MYTRAHCGCVNHNTSERTNVVRGSRSLIGCKLLRGLGVPSRNYGKSLRDKRGAKASVQTRGVISFSTALFESRAPLSRPPWAGSSTIKFR